jgi:hypothetical protein
MFLLLLLRLLLQVCVWAEAGRQAQLCPLSDMFLLLLLLLLLLLQVCVWAEA